MDTHTREHPTDLYSRDFSVELAGGVIHSRPAVSALLPQTLYPDRISTKSTVAVFG